MDLTRPFAENGDRQDFPVDTQGDGTMSLQQGFGAFYGLPPEEGGLFIQRPQFNQLMYLVSKGVIDNKTAIEALNSQYGSLLTSSAELVKSLAKLLTKNLTWTVGTGGDYENLQTALSEACKYQNTGAYEITIKLLENITVTDTLRFLGVNLGFVTIDGGNFNLTINNKNLFEFNACIIPNFKNITLKNSGSNSTQNICGIFSTASIADFNSSKTMTIDNFYNGILSADSANFSGLELIIQNCFRALVAQSLGNLDIRASEIKNCSYGLYVLQSGIIQSQFCSFATVTHETNIAYNTITSEGIIYK
ncbi:hypothetical protein DYU73_01155 [Campylobacter jejuni]|nr:hypothetical protein [Campylobacter jejuni]